MVGLLETTLYVDVESLSLEPRIYVPEIFHFELTDIFKSLAV